VYASSQTAAILEPAGFSDGSAMAVKSVPFRELSELAQPGRCLIVYHHKTRRAGGHHAEIAFWADRLHASGFGTVDAVRAKPYSPRVYFLLDAPPEIRHRAKDLASHWTGLITWHPDTVPRVGDVGPPCTIEGRLACRIDRLWPG